MNLGGEMYKMYNVSNGRQCLVVDNSSHFENKVCLDFEQQPICKIHFKVLIGYFSTPSINIPKMGSFYVLVIETWLTPKTLYRYRF